MNRFKACLATVAFSLNICSCSSEIDKGVDCDFTRINSVRINDDSGVIEPLNVHRKELDSIMRCMGQVNDFSGSESLVPYKVVRVGNVRYIHFLLSKTTDVQFIFISDHKGVKRYVVQ